MTAWSKARMRSVSSGAISLVAMLLLAGCLEVRGGDDIDAGGDRYSNCGDCHHLAWLSSAHLVHIGAAAGRFSAPALGCSDCHAVTHERGFLPTVVEWFPEGGMAGLGGLEPTWDGARCRDTYCHGASLTGGSNTAPAWSEAGEVGCGSCHGLPPPPPHPAAEACEVCHGAAYTDDGLDPSKHIDGVLDFLGGGR